MTKINRYYLTNAKKELGFVAKNKSEEDVRSWINLVYNNLKEEEEEEEEEEDDFTIELSSENDNESQPTDDIQLELEQLLSISQVLVVINNDNINEYYQEDINSDSADNEEDYDPAEWLRII